MVREGAERYPFGMFRVARLGWTVVVSGRQLMDELRSAPADELSFYYSASEVQYGRLRLLTHLAGYTDQTHPRTSR